MRTWAKGTSRAAVLAAGLVVLGVGAVPANAFADTTDGNGSVLGGNQLNAPVTAPVDVSGNGASILGESFAASGGGAKVRRPGGAGQQTSGAFGVGSGNQVNAPVAVPVNVCGNGAAVIGKAVAGCQGGAKVADGGGGDGQTTDGTGGVASGNQVNAPVSVPVNVCGNAVAIIGAAGAGCEGGSVVKGGAGTGQSTSGVFGVGSGNQLNAPVSLPVNVCGNAAGAAFAACEGGASTGDGGYGGSGGRTTDGTFGVLAGNQGNTPVEAPAEVCGNAAAVAGQAAAFCKGGTHVHGGHGGDQYTSGVDGVLAGNQGGVPIKVPADVCGNAAAVAGLAAPLCGDDPGYTSYNRTSGAVGVPLKKGVLPKAAADGIGPVEKVSAVEPIQERPGSSWTMAAAGILAFAAGTLMPTRRVPADRRAPAERRVSARRRASARRG